VICQPIDAAGQPEGSPQVAIDAHGAGMHQQVIISSDGSAARAAVKDPKSPARWMIIGVVDEKAPEVTP
jgi:ethanolamine utilization protein EutN